MHPETCMQEIGKVLENKELSPEQKVAAIEKIWSNWDPYSTWGDDT